MRPMVWVASKKLLRWLTVAAVLVVGLGCEAFRGATISVEVPIAEEEPVVDDTDVGR